MTHQDARTLLDYHYWARDRMLTALEPLTADQYARDLGNSFKSIRDTVIHIYGAEWVWHSRWLGQSPKALPPGADYPDVGSLARAWAEHEAKIRGFVEDLCRSGDDGLSRVFAYTLFSGTAGSSPFAHMLQHVVNHASYHRGQVTTMLRQIGAPPPASMDMITYYRTLQIGSHP